MKSKSQNASYKYSSITLIMIMILSPFPSLASNLKTKIDSFTPENQRLINAKYFLEFYTDQQSFDSYQSNLVSLYKENQSKLEGYYFKWIEGGKMVLNPCSADFDLCKEISDISEFEDKPVVKSSKFLVLLKLFL